MEEFFLEDESEAIAGMDITEDLVQAIAEWNNVNRLLEHKHHRFLEYLAIGRLKMTGKNKYIAARLYKKAQKLGFNEARVSEKVQ